LQTQDLPRTILSDVRRRCHGLFQRFDGLDNEESEPYQMIVMGRRYGWAVWPVYGTEHKGQQVQEESEASFCEELKG